MTAQSPVIIIAPVSTECPMAYVPLRRRNIRGGSPSGRTSLNEARQSGAAKFLAKPYTAIAIQSAVESVIGC